MTARRHQKAREKPPAAMVRMERGRLVPVGSYDAEAVQGYPDGSLFELVPRSRKSRKMERLYWQVLGRFVSGGFGRWRKKEQLHNDLKVMTGHYWWSLDTQTGRLVRQPDTTAGDAMTPAEYAEYCSAAFEKLSQMLGRDVMEILDEEDRNA